MPSSPHNAVQKFVRRIRPSSWVGIVLTALVALLGVSGGFWMMIALVGVVVLMTALYGLAFRRHTWLRLPRKRSIAATGAGIAFVVILGSSVAYGATHPTDESVQASASTSPVHASSPTASPTHPAKPKPTPSLEAHPTPTPIAATAVPAVAPAGSTPGTALALLATLPVKAALPITGYQRTADFGSAWLDMDHNGCDTRNDILVRDLTAITRNAKCQVLTGSLNNPYTGQTIAFQRGEKTSALVQIDHVVALGDAWETGAQALTQTQREQLANDDGNLLAVDEHDNEQKGDKDASAWLPPSVAFQCKYVAIQISIKAAYGLWVTPAESAAMNRVLGTCPSQPVTTAEFASVPAVSVAAAAPVAAAAAQPAPAPTKVAAAASNPAAQAPVAAAPAPAAAAPAPAPAAPAPASAPKAGQFCSNADHGVTLNGLTCTLYASGTWHWKR
jgi:hypothetical protein